MLTRVNTQGYSRECWNTTVVRQSERAVQFYKTMKRKREPFKNYEISDKNPITLMHANSQKDVWCVDLSDSIITLYDPLTPGQSSKIKHSVKLYSLSNIIRSNDN